jgi:chemotaxis response regulator CheB
MMCQRQGALDAAARGAVAVALLVSAAMGYHSIRLARDGSIACRGWHDMTPTRDIIVIGGSAGARQALADLVTALPEGFAASVFVVLHDS